MASENSARPNINPSRPKRLIEKIRTKQNSMKNVRRIFFSERNNKIVPVRTELIAAFKAILVGPTIEPERKILRNSISSIPKFTEKIISHIVSKLMIMIVIEKIRDIILANGRED